MENSPAQFTPPVTAQPAPKSSMNMMVIMIIGLVLITAAGVGGYFLGRQSMSASEVITPRVNPDTNRPMGTLPDNAPADNVGTICTMDAKICPDGSAVGRSGPNCEFAACPTSAATSSAQISFTGVTLPEGAEAAVDEGFAIGMKRDQINDQTIPAQYQQMGFNVMKADANWFWGLGSIYSSKPCEVPPGASECNNPRTSFLLIGHKVNGQWQVGFEYTPAFYQMVSAAPDTITTPGEKQTYKP